MRIVPDHDERLDHWIIPRRPTWRRRLSVTINWIAWRVVWVMIVAVLCLAIVILVKHC
jgi:hypothetical protein